MVNPDQIAALADSKDVALIIALSGYPLFIAAVIKLYRDKEKLVNLLAEALKLNWMSRKP